MVVETVATAIAGGAVRGLISALVKPVVMSAFSAYKKGGMLLPIYSPIDLLTMLMSS